MKGAYGDNRFLGMLIYIRFVQLYGAMSWKEAGFKERAKEARGEVELGRVEDSKREKMLEEVRKRAREHFREMTQKLRDYMKKSQKFIAESTELHQRIQQHD